MKPSADQPIEFKNARQQFKQSDLENNSIVVEFSVQNFNNCEVELSLLKYSIHGSKEEIVDMVKVSCDSQSIPPSNSGNVPVTISFSELESGFHRVLLYFTSHFGVSLVTVDFVFE
ncbi:hypothetical protein GEMRC1_004928 [Eukaryota sp. GEM-RC1]